MKPPVTVLISVYNGADYLRDAIDSVLAQSFADFELMVINNASTDGTGVVIDSYDDSRLTKVLNPELLSLAQSLNKGLGLAKGRYIARLDADDIAMPDRLEKQVAYMEAHPDVAMISSRWEFFEEGKPPVIGPMLPVEHEDVIQLVTEFWPFIHPGMMYRREEILAIGGYPEDFAYSQDMAMGLKVLRNHRCAVLDGVLTKIRRHSGQLTERADWSVERTRDAIRLYTDAQTLPGLTDRAKKVGRQTVALNRVRYGVALVKRGDWFSGLCWVILGWAEAPLLVSSKAFASLARGSTE